MRRVRPALAALALLLAAPVVAAAKPAPPDPTPPALRGAPSLVRDGGHRVTLFVRFDRPLARRYDGEPLATAAIDGRIASLAPLPGRPAAYAARAWIPHAEPGRLVSVSVSIEGPAAETVSALVAISRPRG